MDDFSYKVMRPSFFLRIWKKIFSFETFFVLYLFAGRFKADPRFAWFPVDLTILFMLLSLVSGYSLMIKSKMKLTWYKLSTVLLYFLFAVWSIVTLAWAPFTHYALDKALRILTLVTWAYIGSALFIACDYRRVQRFYVLLVLFSFWITVEALMSYFVKDYSEIIVKEILVNYIGVSRVISMAFGILVITFFDQNKWIVKIFYIISISILFITLLAIGGRGPFIASVIGIILILLLKISLKNVFHISGLFIVVVIMVVLFADHLPMTTIYRLSIISEQPLGGMSIAGRLERIEGALKQFQEAPVLGKGIGSFFYFYGDTNLKRDYPHNLLLEIASETGFVGILFFFMLVFVVICKFPWKLIRSNSLYAVVAYLVINSFINAMVSGDIPDNRVMFAALGLMVGLASCYHQHTEKKHALAT